MQGFKLAGRASVRFAPNCPQFSARVVFPAPLFCIYTMVLTDDVKQSIGQLLAKAEAGDGLVKAGEQVLELLRGCNVVQRMRLPPKAVGIHPSNRDGLGINALDVHSLINDVLEVGFVPSLVHAVVSNGSGMRTSSHPQEARLGSWRVTASAQSAYAEGIPISC